MLKFIFNNSYQSSYVGYQYSFFKAGSQQLEPVTKEYPVVKETKELISNSGCVCALGKTADRKIYYFVFRRIVIRDGDDRTWNINFGIEADDGSLKEFTCLVNNILLDHSAFLESLKKWFFVTPEKALSYDLDFEYVNEFISSRKWIDPSNDDYFKSENNCIGSFVKMLSDLKNNLYIGVLLIVPEATMDYLYKQIPCFMKIPKKYIFSESDFQSLIGHTVMPDEQKETAEDDVTADENREPSGRKLQDWLTEERLEKIKKGATFAIGLSAVVGACCLAKKILFGGK